MQRTIPRSSKVKISFWRGITVPDLIAGFIGLLFLAIIFSNGGTSGIIFGIFFLCIYCTLFFNIGSERIYMLLSHSVKFMLARSTYASGRKDKYGLREIVGVNKESDGFIHNTDGTVTGAIEITPIEFRLLAEDKQNYFIEALAGALRAVPNDCEIILSARTCRPDFVPFAQAEINRANLLLDKCKRGELSKEELQSRYDISVERLDVINEINKDITARQFALCVRGNEKKVKTAVDELCFILNSAGLNAKKTPAGTLIPTRIKKVKFAFGNALVNDKEKSYFFAVTKYPLTVGNAWARDLFDMENTTVTMRCMPVAKDKAIKRIDTAVMELSGRTKRKASKTVESETHLETLGELLISLQNENETLFDTTFIIEALGDTEAQEVKRALQTNGFSYNSLTARQKEGFVSSIIANHNAVKFSTGMPSECIAAAFPFVSNAYIDANGLLIGENDMPVFFDPWKRDDDHVNSNMVIIGKTGSGKSYAAKTLLANLSAENSRIFVLDPESEYGTLAKHLGGKALDVSSSAGGIINPLQIMQTISEDDGRSSDYFAHLRFLEEFFKTVLKGIDSDSLELLNNLVTELYEKFGINENSDISKLSANAFPTFDDLGRLLDGKMTAKYEKVKAYLAKFFSGGRYSNIWNGHTNFKPHEHFISFDFQALFANKNTVVANGQMLLLTKWIENEIINNRKFNRTNTSDKHVIVAIDEAHLFIDEKRPVALDFMFQLAKRIRKYSGMLMVITQSVKDLTGTPEIARKSEAIIAASQYSLIFNLSPNDMTDLCALYDKAGKINEVEQYCITHNPRGTAFFITSPESRTNFKIVAMPGVAAVIDKK